ncbi:unnamed protein product [Lactuca virosa]|uniref:Uncharacterized protein n=1 Tax=Lactuca virosa TaxID=75947 RepID=A0AAU9PI36_9ASTR|nr:unnamed protein product [Lactuca virosa]
MDEGMFNNESTATNFIPTSTILPPPSSPIPTLVPASTISPTFSGVMQEPIINMGGKTYVTGLIIFDYEIRKLCDVAKEHQDLFVEQGTTTKESLDIKLVELKSSLSKEVHKMEENYTLLHSKVDVIVGSITKLVEFNTKYTKQVEAKS